MNLTYQLGADYRYPGDAERYRLVAVDGFIFKFADGHWCTDTVFADLIRDRDGLPSQAPYYEQLTLFPPTL